MDTNITDKRVTVLFMVSDPYLWSLRVALYLWNKSGLQSGWSRLFFVPEVHVAGFTKPDEWWSKDTEKYLLPHHFHSIGAFEDYPKERWSDAFIAALKLVKTTHVLLMLEDYWLLRDANVVAINEIAKVMLQNGDDIVRGDLTSDCIYKDDARDWFSVRDIDVLEVPPTTEYALSLQAAIFNIELLSQYLLPGETAWQTELAGTRRMNERQDCRIIGTRQWALRYIIAINKGKLDLEGRWMRPPRAMPRALWSDVVAFAGFPPDHLLQKNIM